jgi:hypothetical protein
MREGSPAARDPEDGPSLWDLMAADPAVALDLAVRVDSGADAAAMVYDHAVVCELAHARLCQLRDAPAA